jgi:hypothetical protein
MVMRVSVVLWIVVPWMMRVMVMRVHMAMRRVMRMPMVVCVRMPVGVAA